MWSSYSHRVRIDQLDSVKGSKTYLCLPLPIPFLLVTYLIVSSVLFELHQLLQ